MIRLTVAYGPPRKAPPNLRRPRDLDPLQVDVLAALVATLPPKEPRT